MMMCLAQPSFERTMSIANLLGIVGSSIIDVGPYDLGDQAAVCNAAGAVAQWSQRLLA